MERAKLRPVRFILIFYLVCFIFRIIEYFLLRTDQSIIGEAFVHKLAGIGLLAGALWYLGYKWRDIGFRADRTLKDTCIGLAFGGIVFAIAYGVEFLMQSSAGNEPAIQFFVSSYALESNRVMDSSIIFITICVIGNIINVVMEEGIFRGLFTKLAENRYSFIKACILTSLLFGLWHITGPVRNVIDGTQSPGGAAMMALMLVGTSTLAGISFVLMYKLTDALWLPMAYHFVNNTSVNLFHVVTADGVDEMQAVRLTITGTLSFVIVLVIFIVKRKKAITV